MLNTHSSLVQKAEVDNDLADDLSHITICPLSLQRYPLQAHTSSSGTGGVTLRHEWNMDLTRLDEEVHEYCQLRLAPSTNQVHITAVRCFSDFSIMPVCHILLCHNESHLPGIRHAQIMRGFPEPAHAVSLPHLRLVQAFMMQDAWVSVNVATGMLPNYSGHLAGPVFGMSVPAGVEQAHVFAMLCGRWLLPAFSVSFALERSQHPLLQHFMSTFT